MNVKFELYGRVFVLALIVVIFKSVPDAAAQPLAGRFFNYKTEQGLIDNNVRCMAKDKNGFLWIGTENGLSCFDGIRFKNYVFNPNDSNSIPGNVIRNLFVDSKNNLWITTYDNGLCSRNFITGKFERFLHTDNNPNSIATNSTMCVAEDDSGFIWVTLWRKGIDKFDEKHNRFEHFAFDDKSIKDFNFNLCNKIEKDSKGRFKILCQFGIIDFNPATKQFKPLLKYFDDSEKKKAFNCFISIYIDKKDNLWLGTWNNGLIFYDIKQNKWEQFLIKNKLADSQNRIHSIQVKSDSELYIASLQDGFGIFNKQTGQFSFYKNVLSDLYSFPSNDNVNVILATGNEVVVGSRAGLSILSASANKFKLNYCNSFLNKTDTSLSIISCVLYAYPDSLIFLGTLYQKGIYCYNYQKGITKNISYPDDNSLLGVNQFVPVLNQKQVYYACTNKGLLVFDANVQKLFRPDLPDTLLNLLQHSKVFTADVDNENRIWFCTGKVIMLYDQKKKTVAFYSDLIQQFPDLKSLISSCVDHENNLLLSYYPSGVIKIDVKKRTAESLKFKTNSGEIHSMVDDMLFDNKGNLWLMLKGTGIGIYNSSASNVKYLSTVDGLSSSRFTGIVKDNDGRIWVSSENALDVIDAESLSILNFTRKQGYPSNKFCSILFDGQKLFLAGADLFASWHAKEFLKSNKPQNVTLTALQIFGNDFVSDSSIACKNSITLLYNQNFISIEFAAPEFNDADGITYFYKLEGLHEKWISNGKNNSVSFTITEGGSYSFKVKARNGAGLWSENESTLTIIMIPPFYKTWWFMLILVFSIAVFIFYVVKMRIRRIRKEAALKTEFNKKIVELEMTALRAQMNPHFIFNCLNSINRYIIKSDKDTASGYVTKFSRLIRLILDNSRSNEVSLENELTALRLYIEMEQMRFDNKFSFKIEIDEGIDPLSVNVPPMILQPYVENAIWHGLMHRPSGGHINISINKKDNLLICTIDDDGIGRQAAGEIERDNNLKSKSHGLIVTGKRLSIYNESEKDQITVIDKTGENGKATGTTVIIKIIMKQIL